MTRNVSKTDAAITIHTTEIKKLTVTLFGCFSGIGFAIALLLFASLRERLEFAAPPKAFEGIPIGLITAGILAMAFVGFAGLC